jgi:hypothetical protein
VTRRLGFRRGALHDLAALDPSVRARIDAALVRLRVGKWRIFFFLESPDIIEVLGIDNRGEAY